MQKNGYSCTWTDINESNYHFTVNQEGAIRFGLGAIKGLGSGPVNALIEERTEKGHFKSIFDLAKRINLRVCNKKAFESLAYAGGFDSLAKIWCLPNRETIRFLKILLSWTCAYERDSFQSP